MFNNQTLYCPVCHKHLGRRNKIEEHFAKCEECSVMWLWHKGLDKPVPVIKQKVVRCGCGCGR